MRGTRTIIAISLAVSLLAASCGDDDDDGATDTDTTTTAAPPADTTTVPTDGTGAPADTTTTGAEVELTDSFRGVTADTIKIGVALLDFEQLADLGFIDRSFGDLELAYEAAIAEINENGGILGRQIEAEYDIYFPVGDAEGLETCVKFTEDDEVFAVLGVIPALFPTVIECITGEHETIHIGHELTRELIDNAGGLLVTSDITADRLFEALLSLLVQTGDLEGRTIAIYGNQDGENRINDILVPAFEAAGFEIADVGIVDTSSADTASIAADTAVVAERFRSNGVDTVFGAGLTSPSQFPTIFQVLGEVQFYSDGPSALLDQGQTAEDKTPFEGAISLEGMNEDDGEQFAEPNMVACVANFQERNPDIPVINPGELPEGAPNVFAGARDACNELAVLVAGATAAGPNLTNETWIEGIQTVGDIGLYAKVFASFGPGKFDAEDGFRLVRFSATVGDNGGYENLTEILDVSAD